jgi:hypothetical protein
VVALALAGTLAAGGLWMAGGAQTAPGLRSPTGGPGPRGSGVAASRAGTDGSLPPARPATDPVTGERSAAPPSARARAAAQGAGVTRRDRPPATRPAGHGKPPRTKPATAKPGSGKPKPGSGKSKAQPGTP